MESSTGQYADLGLQLGDQSGYELSLKNQNDLLQTLTSGNGLVTTNLTTAQAALNSIRSGAQSAVASLTSWTSTEVNSGSTLQSLGANALAVADRHDQHDVERSICLRRHQLQRRADGRLFLVDDVGRQERDRCGVSDGRSASRRPTRPPRRSRPRKCRRFLSGTFADQFSGANWTSNWSSASSTNTSAQIAPGETIDTSTNANQTGFQQLAQGYAMLAEFGGSQLSSAAQQAVASTANSLITQGMTSITATEADVGASLQRVTDANSSMSSQMTILQTQIGNLDNVNSATVATQAQYAVDATADRLPTHGATAEAEPRPISSYPNRWDRRCTNFPTTRLSRNRRK